MPIAMARGTLRSGRSAMSAGSVLSSNPAKAQKMSTRACPASAAPPVRNGTKFEAAADGCRTTYAMPPRMMSTSGLSLMIVRASLVRPAALIPTTLVATMIPMNRAFRPITPAGPTPGTRAVKYWAKATGNTDRENHSASRRAHPVMKPAKGPAAAPA